MNSLGKKEMEFHDGMDRLALKIDGLVAERDHLQARVKELEGQVCGMREVIKKQIPELSHEGPCGPESGCDTICMEKASLCELIAFSPCPHEAEIAKLRDELRGVYFVVEIAAQEIARLKKVAEAISQPAMLAGNSDAIAFHLEQGKDNGNLTREALAAWLREVAEQIDNYCQALADLEKEEG